MVWLPVSRWHKQRLAGLPPGAAGDAAFRIFCTPEISQWRQPAHATLVARARYHLRAAERVRVETPVGAVQTYRIKPEGTALGTVLVLHGWTSESSFMAALAEPVRRAGFNVLLMDMPAHGLSALRATNLIDCARALLAVGQSYGPIAGIVAHSFGGMVALLAMEGGPPLSGRLDVPRIVLVSCPNRIAEITALFARHWHLSAGGLKAFERRLERVGQRAISDFTAVKLLDASGASALVIHARDDAAVPFGAAEEIASGTARTQLKVFEGLGHSNILFAPQVARAAVGFLKQS
jgi:pimeloyl-ACP methyl ester carboxylesterase